MNIEHVYVKKRSEFGKRCYFSEYDKLEVDIKSDTRSYAHDFVRVNPISRGTMCAKQMAAHEVSVFFEAFFLHLL